MLTTLRMKAGTWAVKIFLGILAASFVLWGVGDYLTVRPDNAVLIVGDRDITGSQLIDEFNRDVSRLQARFGGSFTSQQARDMGYLERTIASLLTRTLYDSAVGELGLTVSDKDVAAEIRKNRNFHDELGRFDRNRFEQALRYNNFSEQSYVAMNRRDMTRSQLFESLSGGAGIANSVIEAIHKYQNERRVVATVAVPLDKMAAIAPPSGSDIDAYHQKHKTRYMWPEFRALTYFTLSPEDLIDEVSASPEAVKEDYENRIEEFTRHETREIEQILAGDKAKAEQIITKMAAGGDFFALAKEIAEQEAAEVKLGTLRKGQLPAETADQVFALEEGGVNAIEGPFGWAVYRVAKINPGKVESLEDVRNKVERELKLHKAADIMVKLANRIEDELGGGASLMDAARSANIEVKTVAKVDAQGRGPDGKPVPELPKIAKFLATAFASDQGDEPQLDETDAGAYFSVVVDDIIDPALKPVSNVRADIVKAIEIERQGEAARKIAGELAEQARGGAKLADLAAKKGFTYKAHAPLTRNELPHKAGPDFELTGQLFKASPNDVLNGAGLRKKSILVARLLEVKEAIPSANKDQTLKLGGNLRQSVANDMMAQYRVALEKEFDVEIKRGAIEALFEQIPTTR